MTNSVEEKVDQLFAELNEGRLQSSAPRLESGWEMRLPSGETVARSTLQAQAQTAIELGAAAVPYLLPMVRNENLALRYVATYSLEFITGQKSPIPHFSREVTDAQLDQAIQTWQQWYLRQQAAE